MKSAVSFAVAKCMVMRAVGVKCHNIRFPRLPGLPDVRDPETIDHTTRWASTARLRDYI